MILRKSELTRRAILVLAILISGGNLLFPRVPILMLIVLLYLIARHWTVELRPRMLPILILLSAILILTLLRADGGDVLSTATRFANFLAAVVLLDLYLHAGAEALRKDLYVLLHPMAWQALLTVPLGQFFDFLFLPLPVNDTPYETFLGVFNFHTLVDDYSALVRPDGFFYEPGVFQVYLNIFLYLSLFVFKSAWKSVLAAAAVFSTQSTTGVFICLTIVFVFLATRYLNRGTLPVRVMKVFVAALVVAAFGLAASVNFKDKFTGESQGSYWARQYDLLTGINIIVEHPLLGIGFNYDQYYRASSHLGFADTQLPDRIIQDRGNSNGIIFLLYSIGIPLSIPFFMGMFRQTLFPDRMLFGMLLLLAFSGESILFTPFFLMIVFSGLMLRRRAVHVTHVAHGV